MTDLDASLGATIQRLSKELQGLPAGILRDIDTEPLESTWLEARRAQNHIEWQQGQRVKIRNIRRQVKSEIHGCERGLALIEQSAGDGGSAVTSPSTVGIEHRIVTNREALGGLDREISDLDNSIARTEERLVEEQQKQVRELQNVLAELWKQQPVSYGQAAAKPIPPEGHTLNTEEVMWSPTPIMGYRLWDVRSNGLFGSWQKWAEPKMVATCVSGEGVPHVGRPCSDVAFGCGVYTAKSVRRVLKMFGITPHARIAVGLVGMEGRVVEHVHGYRAERATVQAMVIVLAGNLWGIGTPAKVARVFANTSLVTAIGTHLPEESSQDESGERPTMWKTIDSYLAKKQKETSPWT